MNPEASASERLIRSLNSLLDVSKAMAAVLDLDSLLAVILDKATEVMEAERASIFIYDEPTRTLWNRVSGSLARGQVRVSLGSGIAGHVAETGRLLNVPDAYADPRFNREVDRVTGFHTRAMLCAPLLGHPNKLIGVIQILNKLGGGVFTSEDESLLLAFASHAAVALDRARLVEAFVEKQRSEEGLRLAHQIQMAMLPKRFPQESRFQLCAEVLPARAVGGDLYDFALDGDRLWFLVGDVAGKGVAAALFMAVAKTLLRASLPGAPSPSVVLSRVNAELAQDNDGAMFVTVFLGRLDLATGDLAFANAGHNPPYRLGAGAPTSVGEPRGVPLGVVASYQYETGNLRLERGEGLYLYTDGVTEALADTGEQFSARRLEAYLRGAAGAPATELVRGSLAAAQDFAGGMPPFDDITVMALRYAGAAAVAPQPSA